MGLRVAHLSDLHFGGEDRPAVEAVLSYLQATPPDLTLVTGDVTLNGTPSEFRAASAWLQRIPRPSLCTPGNHDTPYWNLVLRALQPFRRYRRHIGPVNSDAFVTSALAVKMINTARGAQPRPDWSKGAISLEDTQAAVVELGAATPAALRVVGCHHPLIEMQGAPVSGSVHRGAAAADRLARGGIDLILTGHVHTPFAIALPYGDALTYAVGAGTLSLRTRGTPPSFNLIGVDDQTIEVRVIAWTGAALEPLQVWRLPRRASNKTS